MAGYWALSRTQVLDANDNLIPGALAYFFEAGTSTPMTVYSSVSLGEINEHSHPVAADGNARWPQVFFDDEAFQFYRVRVTDAGGILIYDDDSVPIIGQAESGGGGPAPVPVNPDTLATTGDVKVRFDNAALSGWVRMNGKTISKTGSGGTERANDDTESLYSHLWGKANQTICEVIGGRGANALADFAAGRQLTLPDMRGRAAFGIDIMNNASSGRIAAAYMDTGGVNELGASGGDDAIVLVADNIAAHQHPGAGGNNGATPPVAVPLVAASHTHLMVDADAIAGAGDSLAVTTPLAVKASGVSAPGGTDPSYNAILGAGTIPDVGRTSQPATTAGVVIPGGVLAVTGNTGSNVTTGAAHENMPPFMLFTYYIKL